MLTFFVMRHSLITLVTSRPAAVAYAVKLPLIVTLVSAPLIFQARAVAQDHANSNDSRTKSFTDLQITSPVSGTIVKPGQSFSVSVASPNSTAFTTVMVVAPDPFAFSTLQKGAPTRVSFTV